MACRSEGVTGVPGSEGESFWRFAEGGPDVWVGVDAVGVVGVRVEAAARCMN